MATYEDELRLIVKAVGLEEVERSIQSFGGASKKAEKSTKGLTDALTKGVVAAGALTAGMGLLFRQSSVLGSLLEVQGALFGALADVILVSLIPVFEPLIDFMVQLIGWFQELPEPAKQFIAAMMLAVPAIGAVAAGIIAVTIAGAPLIAAILAIAAAIGVAVVIWQNWDQVVAGFEAYISGPVIEAFSWFAQQTESIWRPLGDFFAWLWETAIRPIFELWLDYVAAWAGLFTDPVGTIQEAWGRLVGFFSGLWNTLATGADSVASAMRDAFAGAFNAIVGGMKATYNSMVGLIEAAINSFANAVNEVIQTINNAGDWLGIPDIPLLPTIEIPRLQEGGIVMEPTLAMVGEGGPEAVVPLDRAGGGGEYHIHLHLDNREIARGVLETLRRDRELVLRSVV